MTVEKNFEFQRGETWIIPFEGDVDISSAEIGFILSRDDVVIIELSTTSSPAEIIINSPEISGEVIIDPDRQDYSTSPDAGLSVSPGAYNYEIRADYTNGSPVGGVTVLQYGKLIVQASLFAWPVVS